MQLTKLFWILSAGVIFAGGVFAQIKTSTDESWMSYGVAEGIVTIDLPSKPKEDHSFDKKELSYFSSLNGAYFAIIADAPGKDKPFQTALGFVRLHQIVPTFEQTGLVRSERYQFEDGDGFFHTVIAFSNAARSVLIHGISRANNDSVVTRVFNSVTISGVQVDKLAVQESTDRPTQPPLPKPDSGPAPLMSPRQVSGQESGNGPGNTGSARGSGVEVASAPMAVTTPLRIESKPKPPYTDMARLYMIEGTVRVKVALLAGGQVGAVTPVTFLPFGLIQNAIAAARSVEFTPRRVNGVPMSSIVTFEYGFSIY